MDFFFFSEFRELASRYHLPISEIRKITLNEKILPLYVMRLWLLVKKKSVKDFMF